MKYKPGKVNKNADALSRIKINHFANCSEFQTDAQLTPYRTLLTTENSDDENPENIENEENRLTQHNRMYEEFDTFVELYKTQSVIDYSKIEFSNDQLLDKKNKNIVSFFRQNELTEINTKIIEDIFEENADFENLKINLLSSKTVKNRKYFIIALPYNPDTVNEYLFGSLYLSQDLLLPDETYCVETKVDLPILEILSFINAEKEIKFKVFQNVTRTPEGEQIPTILDQCHNGKNNLYRGINETIRRIKEKERTD